MVMAIGIEFKNGSVNLVEAKVKRNSVVCKSAFSFDFEGDWIDQQGISDSNFDNLLMVFEQKLEEFGLSDIREGYVCLNNTSVIYREIITPKIDEKKLAFIVRSEMMDTLNLTPDYIMDFIILESILDENEREAYRLLAVAVLDSALESYINLLRSLKIKPVVIDSATNAIIKVMETYPVMEKMDQVIITEVGDGHLRLYLFDRGQYILSRNVRLVTYSDFAKDEYLDTIEDNISKMIQFSYTRGIKNGVDKIFLIGKDEILDEINERVNKNLLVDSEILSQPSFVDGDCEFQTQYTNVLGTMLRK